MKRLSEFRAENAQRNAQRLRRQNTDPSFIAENAERLRRRHAELRADPEYQQLQEQMRRLRAKLKKRGPDDPC